MSETSALTTNPELLEAVERGDAAALTVLFSLVYDELSALAHQQRRRWHGNITLDTTALVHEVYLQDGGTEPARIRESRAFFRRRGESVATDPVQLGARPKPTERTARGVRAASFR